MSDLETPQPKRRGVEILHDPRLNKMTGFSEEEREARRLGLCLRRCLRLGDRAARAGDD